MGEAGEGKDSESAFDRGLGETFVVSRSLFFTSDGANAPSGNMTRSKGKIPVAQNTDTMFDALSVSRKGALLSGATS